MSMSLIQRVFATAAWFLALLIILLSLVPPSLRPVTALPHNVEHFLIFLATGVCFLIGYPRKPLADAIGLAVFAGAVELAQRWAPGRHARVSDFMVDALAALIGVTIAWLGLRFAINIFHRKPSS
jgi:VanZ family protein